MHEAQGGSTTEQAEARCAERKKTDGKRRMLHGQSNDRTDRAEHAAQLPSASNLVIEQDNKDESIPLSRKHTFMIT